MAVLEGKKITIRLPRFSWRLFISLRFGIIFFLFFCAAAFTYWYMAIRPFLWISSAHVESFSAIVGSDMPGRIAEMGAQEGERVQKGKILFALDRDLIFAQQRETQEVVNAFHEEVRMEKMRMEKAMNDYLALTNESELGIEFSDVMGQHLEILEDSQAKSEAAASQLAKEQTKLSYLDLQLKKMAFTAPFDGIVLKRTKTPGAVISFGEPVYVLSDPARTWIEAEVPESELSRISIGAPARIRFLAYPKKEWKGQVFWIGPATVSNIASKSDAHPFSKQNETIPIKISLENPDSSLKPGLSAQIGLKVY